MASGRQCINCGKTKDPDELTENGGVCDECLSNPDIAKRIARDSKLPWEDPNPDDPDPQ